VANPATILDIRSIRYEFANEKRMKLIIEVNIESNRIGLLPTRSEIPPNIGEKINCIIENEVISIPKAAGPV